MAWISNSSAAVLRILVVLLFLLSKGNPYEMEGSQTSYAKYRRWDPCENGTLSLEFKTKQEHGVLLYADDGGLDDFMEVKLVAGMARLRLNLGSGTIILTVGNRLNDYSWHNITIVRNSHQTQFILDGSKHSKNISGPDLIFGNISQNSDLFIGGLPVGYTGRLRMLALPSIMFEPRFRGSIRNVLYSQCGEPKIQADMIDYSGIRQTSKDSCSGNNKCKNRGLCISKDSGYFCDCTRTGFSGNTCEIEILPKEVTFYGAEYISYDLTSRGDTILSNRDQVSMHFKTRAANGLLFYTGEGKDHIIIYLQHGGIHVSVNLGTGVFEQYLDPKKMGGRFDDNTWHTIEITRMAREIGIVVDNKYKESGTTTGDFTMLSSRVLYLAGSGDVKSLEGSRIQENFRGCMKQVFYRADSIILDIVSLAHNQHEFLHVKGTPEFDHCDLAYAQPITFLNEDSVIKVHKHTLTDTGSIMFTFRTNEPTGLLMYSPGIDGTSDFFALELYEGTLYLILDLGSGVVKIEATKGVVESNNVTHRVVLTHNGSGTSSISVDGITTVYKITGTDEQQLNLEPVVYVGAIYDDGLVSNKIPPQVLSAALNQGYVGCFQDMMINNERIDIAQLARTQKVKGVGDYCKAEEPLHCHSMPCMHRGVCSEGWNRYICDCSATGYTGHMCHQVAVTLTFDGTQYMKITLEDNSTSEGEDISLRFQTEKENGLLLATSAAESDDRLILALDGGMVRVDVNIGGVKQTIRGGENLGDNEWHTIKVRRRNKRLLLSVDDGKAQKEKINMKNPRLQLDEINIGSENGSFNARLTGANSASMNVDNIELGKKTSGTSSTSVPENFVGNMQQLIYNRKHFFDMAFRSGRLAPKYVNTNAKVNHEEKLVEYPFTIKTPAAYIVCREKMKTTFDIYFRFKTTQANGLILYRGNGNGNDFMALELHNGKVRYIFDFGNSPRVLESTLAKAINDNEWHNVSIVRVNLRQHILRVDDSSAIDMMDSNSAFQLNSNEEFYVGGATPKVFEYLPNQVKSKDGYQGCLGSLDLDRGHTKNIFQSGARIPEMYKHDVIEGCEGPQEVCRPNSCKNAGVCIQRWNSIRCDCDMTSFTGPECEEVSTAYKFEGEGGVIRFHFLPSETAITKIDKLALGFKTTKRDAVLTRIDSANSNDYIEMELIDGNIFVVYNMGTIDHPIGVLFDRVNDGKYHVVRFTRSGPNSTIQVDNLNKQTKNPTGHQLNFFNNVSNIYIGGKKDIRGRIMRPFVGTIAGYVLNGKRILDYAADSDPRVTIEKEVQLDLELEVEDPKTSSVPTNSTTPSSSLNEIVNTSAKEKNDADTLVSGAGSGCGPDDHQCASHTTDSLIKPTVHIVSKSTTTQSTSTASTTPKEETETSGDTPDCEDDEDCVGVSGHKHVTTDDMVFVEESNTTEAILIDANITEQSKTLKPTQAPGHETPPMISWSSSTSTTTKRGGGGVGVPGGGGGSSGGKTESPKLDNVSDPNKKFVFNIGLIVGIAASVVLLILILAYALYKYRSRDVGTYKVDEGKNYRYETVSTKPPSQNTPQQNGSSLPKPVSNGPKAKKKGSVKEWYV